LVARRVGWPAMVIATLILIAVLGLLPWRAAIMALAMAAAVVLMSGLYYCARLNGITGDCLGATNQLTEVAVYLARSFFRSCERVFNWTNESMDQSINQHSGHKHLRLYLLRHGDIEQEANPAYYGHTDVNLSSRGVEQSHWLSDRLASSPHD
jgi:hypothetical protein